MKIFNEKDLITWANREKAEVGKEYYFADSLEDLRVSIKNKIPCALININKDNCAYTFKNEHLTWYACILPIYAVKEEKKYRACKTIKEFYELVNDYGSDSFSNNDFTDENFIYNLLDTTIHYRSKNTGREFYSLITSIIKHEEGYLVYLGIGYFLSELFDNFEIEINGKWQPFGVLED